VATEEKSAKEKLASYTSHLHDITVEVGYEI
jgi:hypothetical protein